MEEKTWNDCNSESYFHSEHYLRHNARRLEHLESLRIPVAGKTILDIGAGIGDHLRYYADKGCCVTAMDCREGNLRYLRSHYPDYNIQYLDAENLTATGDKYDVIHCYGLLYHLATPKQAIEHFGQCCNMLFLEACVSYGGEDRINLVYEDKDDPTQSMSGTGCRPTRAWLMRQLKASFPFVYMPNTQPNHEEFPIDWTAHDKHQGLARAIFIAAKGKIENESLSTELLEKQIRLT
jgi:SAM-dependent methyltransferase